MTSVNVDVRYEWEPSKSQVVFVATILSMPELGESLLCEREPTNFNDRCMAVSVVKDDIISLGIFLLRNGTIDCTQCGNKKYSKGILFIATKFSCVLIS